MTTPAKRSGFEFSLIAKAFVLVMMMTIMADAVVRLFAGSTSTLVTQYIQSRMYQGVTDPRVCEVDSDGHELDLINNSPYTPWVSAQFINDGPDSVWITVNGPSSQFEVKLGETATINRIGALERISLINLDCEAGEEATVRVIGEY